MSTIKISSLPENNLTTNTSNTIFIGVDLENNVTGIYTYGQLFEEPNAYSEAAFLKANTPSIVSNSAFIQANAAYDTANSAEDFANAAFITANSSYLAQNTTASFANGAFVTANASYTAQNTTSSFANGAFNKANSGFATANSAASFANGSFDRANSSYVTANSGASFANAAFTKANSSLQNTTTITVNTNLTVPGILTVNGPLYAANVIATTNVFPGSQTAITLDFTNSRMVKANLAADLIVTPSSFIPGKIVDLILTNTSGQQHAITHGCSAINSTVGATSFNLGSTRTAVLRYFSYDIDLANTYVSITYQ